jgi:phage tail sheath gpL-like
LEKIKFDILRKLRYNEYSRTKGLAAYAILVAAERRPFTLKGGIEMAGLDINRVRNPEMKNYVIGLVQEGTPVNGVAATGTLTFTGVVTDGQTVTIGTRVYEFDTNATVTAGNVAVDVSGGATASAAVTALVAAITGDTSAVVTAVDGAGDTVVVTAKTKGAAANSYASTETCTNASWGAATLAGGVNSTLGRDKELYADSSYLYISVGKSLVSTTNWRRVSLGTAY